MKENKRTKDSKDSMQRMADLENRLSDVINEVAEEQPELLITEINLVLSRLTSRNLKLAIDTHIQKFED